MRVLSSILALVFVVTLASCGGGGNKDITKMAKKMCECAELTQGESPDMEKASACQSDMMKMIGEMEEKYKDADEADEEKMEGQMKDAIKKHCPDQASSLGF